MKKDLARAIVRLDFQYAHRFMNWHGEASYLHGHSGLLEIELEGTPDEHGFVYPIKDAQKIAWEVADNFHHATVFQEGDPLLGILLAGYQQAGMYGTTNRFGPPAKQLNHPLVWSYPESRIAVTKKVSSCENFCEIFYELLKDRLPIKKVSFRSSSLNAASREF